MFEAGNKYGESIIKEYSVKLLKELGKGYSERNLRNMRQFYKINEKWQTVSAKLSWSHYCEILWFEESKYFFYLKLIEEQNLSIRQLRIRIKSNEYERLNDTTKSKILSSKEISVVDYVKNPIKIKNNNEYEYIYEKMLQKLILEDLDNFLKELGNSFCYIEKEFKIRIGDTYNYIDLLLYNIRFKC